MKNIIKISLSYINGKNKSFFAKFHSFLAITGIMLGVTSLIIVSSVMQGYSEFLYNKYYSGYDISVTGTPDTVSELYKKFAVDQNVKNIWKIKKVNFLNNKANVENVFITNKYSDLKMQEIATNINILKYEKQYIPITIKNHSNKIIEQDIFKIKKGINGFGFNVYMKEDTFKNSFFIPYKLESGFQLEWKNIKEREHFFNILKEYKNDIKIETWINERQEFLNALDLEEFVIKLVLFFIIVVSCFNIISTLTLIITEKKQDIYILKTIGYSNKSIISIFSLIGLVLGFFGIVLGTIFGILITENLITILDFIYEITSIRLIPETLMNVPYVININEIISINSFTALIILISSIIPAITTFRISPAEGLKDA